MATFPTTTTPHRFTAACLLTHPDTPMANIRVGEESKRAETERKERERRVLESTAKKLQRRRGIRPPSPPRPSTIFEGEILKDLLPAAEWSARHPLRNVAAPEELRAETQTLSISSPTQHQNCSEPSPESPYQPAPNPQRTVQPSRLRMNTSSSGNNADEDDFQEENNIENFYDKVRGLRISSV